MNVLFTVGLIAAVALWALAVLRRLARLRTEIALAWQRLESDLSNEAVKRVYNNHVTAYNTALEAFPASVIAPLSGFKPARHFQ